MPMGDIVHYLECFSTYNLYVKETEPLLGLLVSKEKKYFRTLLEMQNMFL